MYKEAKDGDILRIGGKQLYKIDKSKIDLCLQVSESARKVFKKRRKFLNPAEKKLVNNLISVVVSNDLYETPEYVSKMIYEKVQKYQLRVNDILKVFEPTAGLGSLIEPFFKSEDLPRYHITMNELSTYLVDNYLKCYSILPNVDVTNYDIFKFPDDKVFDETDFYICNPPFSGRLKIKDKFKNVDLYAFIFFYLLYKIYNSKYKGIISIYFICPISKYFMKNYFELTNALKNDLMNYFNLDEPEVEDIADLAYFVNKTKIDGFIGIGQGGKPRKVNIEAYLLEFDVFLN